MKIYNALDNLIIDNRDVVFGFTSKLSAYQKDDLIIPLVRQLISDKEKTFEVLSPIHLKRNNLEEDAEIQLIYEVDIRYNDPVRHKIYTLVVIEQSSLIRPTYRVKIIDKEKRQPVYSIKFDIYNFKKEVKIELKEDNFVKIVDLMIVISDYVKSRLL